MRTALIVPLLLAAAAAGGSLDDRMDGLVERWRTGDAPARAGVLAETKALGDEALAILLDRLAKPQDFPARDPGVAMSESGGQEETLVSVEVHFAEAQAVGGKARLLSPEEVSALGEVTRVSAPRLTVFDGQRANISVLEQQEYVRTYDEKRAPVKGTVQTGVVLDLRPVVSADRKFVTLELRCVRAALEGGITEIDTPGGKIGVPQVVKREAALTVTVPDAGGTTLALPATGDEKPLLLTLRTEVMKRVRIEDFPGEEIELR